MFNIKPLLQRLHPQEKTTANFVLYQDQLFSKKRIEIKHDRIQFLRKSFAKLPPIELVDLQGESFYLLLIHVDNIAHFFHDVFFPFYYEWRKNKKRVCVSINGNQFQREFLESLIDKKYLVFLNRNTAYQFSDLILTSEGRDLQIYSDYVEVCREIKSICFANHHIVESRSKNLIYGRNELSRKNLLDIDPVFLKANNIEQVFLSTLSFKDYLSTLATARTFTYMVGAGVFNLLFLDCDVEVLEINPHRNNSWAEMFGLSRLCRFNVIVSNNLKPSSAATQDELILDSHVYFDRKISDAIQDLVSRHN
jgi:hypothetical protein